MGATRGEGACGSASGWLGAGWPVGAGGGSLLRVNLVVPLRQGRAGEPLELRHLLGADLDALGVGLGHPGGGDLQASRGGRGAEVGQDRLEAVERSPGPVEAEETEQAGFDRVPLAAAAAGECWNSDYVVRFGPHCS